MEMDYFSTVIIIVNRKKEWVDRGDFLYTVSGKMILDVVFGLIMKF